VVNLLVGNVRIRLISVYKSNAIALKVIEHIKQVRCKRPWSTWLRVIDEDVHAPELWGPHGLEEGKGQG